MEGRTMVMMLSPKAPAPERGESERPEANEGSGAEQ